MAPTPSEAGQLPTPETGSLSDPRSSWRRKVVLDQEYRAHDQNAFSREEFQCNRDAYWMRSFQCREEHPALPVSTEHQIREGSCRNRPAEADSATKDDFSVRRSISSASPIPNPLHHLSAPFLLSLCMGIGANYHPCWINLGARA